MAFEVFNFGKQLGIVGDNSTKQNEPVSYNIEVPVVETETWTGGGGYWRQGSPTYVNIPEDSNPIEWGGTWLPGPWIWNDGPDLRSTRTRTVPGTYRPWEVPKIIDLISESTAQHPYWLELCDGANRQTCSVEYITEVMRMIADILDPSDFTDRLQQKFYWILECMRHVLNSHQIKFACCPGKPLADDRFMDASWRQEILRNQGDPPYGIVWLDPSRLPTRVELIRALTMRCGGYDGRQNEYSVNDVTAYLIAGEKPPCTLLQGMIDSIPKYSNLKNPGVRILDKYFAWEPDTGEVYFRLADGSTSTADQMNIGEESYWKCKVVRNPDRTYRYKCCD